MPQSATFTLSRSGLTLNLSQVGLGKKTLYLPEQEEMPSTEDRFEMANDVGIAQADSVRP
jgi:hypothetical protein